MPHTHWRTRTLQHLSDEMWPVTSPHPTKFKTFQSQHENTVKHRLVALEAGFTRKLVLSRRQTEGCWEKMGKIAETVQLTPSADLSTLKVLMRLPLRLCILRQHVCQIILLQHQAAQNWSSKAWTPQRTSNPPSVTFLTYPTSHRPVSLGLIHAFTLCLQNNHIEAPNSEV